MSDKTPDPADRDQDQVTADLGYQEPDDTLGGRRDLAWLSVTRPLLIMVMNLLIVIAGLAALLGVEVRELPDIDRPIVSVRAVYPGAAPETMDSEVTSRLEDAVARVSGVQKLESASEENNARIRAKFAPGIDLDSAASEVREAVSQASRDLPERVEQVTVFKADNDARPIITLAVSSETLGADQLTQIVDNDIIPELLTQPGVASISTFGTREQQMRVEFDPYRLNRFGLTLPQLSEALQAAPFDQPVGSFRSDAQQLVVRAEASAATPEKISQINITPEVKLKDVASAQLAPSDASSFTRLNQQPIIGLGVVRQANSNTIEISEGVQAAVKRLNDRFDNFEISITTDDARFIKVSVQEVLITLLVTISVVIATIWLFFGSLKATLIPAVSIPISLIGVIAGIWLMGYSINLLTLLALVLATGLIVDDAIVVLENVLRVKQTHEPKLAAILGTRQVFFAVVATTAVLVSVFVPISFLPSEVGRLFREFGFVLALSVVISSFVSLTLVPALASYLGPDLSAKLASGSHESTEPNTESSPESSADLNAGLGTDLSTDFEQNPIESASAQSTVKHSQGWHFAALEGLKKLGARLNRGYAKALDQCLKRPWAVVGVAVLIAFGCGIAQTQVGRELVPSEDRAALVISATGPDGVGLEYMDEQLTQIEAVLKPLQDDGLITSVFAIVGRYDPNRVQVTATLAPWEERDLSQQDIADQIRGPLSQIPGSRVSVRGDSSLSFGGGGDRIEVDLRGSDYAVIYAAARRLAEAMDTESDGVFSASEISYQPTQPQLSIEIDRLKAADLGVDLDELALTLSASVGGRDIADLNVDDRSIPINLRTQSSSMGSTEDLNQLKIQGRAGLIPLSSITKVREQGIAAELDRSGQRRSIQVTSDITTGTLAEAVERVQALADQTLGEDVDAVFAGEAESLQETSNEVLLTYGFALVIVFLVLVAQFESLISPLVIMITVPFALAAALIALIIGSVSLNIYSQIGLVMLIGIMAKNGVLITEFADQLRSEGRSNLDAIREAAKLRLRPIAMTLISTVLGALPLVLASGAGAEARRSIGWVIFGGLGMAGLFTLFLTPAVYLLLSRYFRRDSKKPEAQAKAPA